MRISDWSSDVCSSDLVFRIAIIEHVRFPFLIRRFYDLGPGLASARLAELLLEAQRRGDLREGDCAMAADHFVAMIRGNVHLQVVLRLRAPPLANDSRAMEIGRASGRESGGQDVVLWGVAGY